jgi:hypothetical protein
MKVIKEGRKQKGWAREFTCTGVGNDGGGCGAKLLVEQGDVFHTYHYDYGGGEESYNTFRCPSCKVLTDLPESVRLPFEPHRRELQLED